MRFTIDDMGAIRSVNDHYRMETEWRDWFLRYRPTDDELRRLVEWAARHNDYAAEERARYERNR